MFCKPNAVWPHSAEERQPPAKPLCCRGFSYFWVVDKPVDNVENLRIVLPNFPFWGIMSLFFLFQAVSCGKHSSAVGVSCYHFPLCAMLPKNRTLSRVRFLLRYKAVFLSHARTIGYAPEMTVFSAVPSAKR